MKKSILVVLSLILLAWIYTNSLVGVNAKVKVFYQELKLEMKRQGLKPTIFVISGRRWKIDNYLLSIFNNAASKSRHKHGEAIDFIVLDVNGDGKCNQNDVNLVYALLDKKIVASQGGIGTYQSSSSFFNRQMIHIDCRGKRARWRR